MDLRQCIQGCNFEEGAELDEETLALLEDLAQAKSSLGSFEAALGAIPSIR